MDITPPSNTSVDGVSVIDGMYGAMSTNGRTIAVYAPYSLMNAKFSNEKVKAEV